MSKFLYDLSPNELLHIRENIYFYKYVVWLSYPVFVLPIFLLIIIFPNAGAVSDSAVIFTLVLGAILSVALNFWASDNIESITTSYGVISNRDIIEIIDDTHSARKAEIAMNYGKAVAIWERMGLLSRAAHIRTLMTENSTVKVDQTVVHGDYVDDRDTIVKDSVINKSNIGAGGKSKAEELRDAKALLDDGIIDDDEFKQMNKEILGK